MNNAIILTNGLLTTSDAKTAHGLIRGTEKFTIVGVIDGIETAGNDAGNMLDGKHRNIPVFSSLEEAMENINKVDFLIIGVATVGGKLPGNMLEVVRKAIQKGISIVNGLHEYLNDKEDIVKQLNAYSDTIESTKKQAFAQENAAAALQKARMNADLEINVERGEATYEDVQKAESNQQITPEKKASLFKALDNATEKKIKKSESFELFLGQKLSFGVILAFRK
jgi:hypothetical protein